MLCFIIKLFLGVSDLTVVPSKDFSSKYSCLKVPLNKLIY